MLLIPLSGHRLIIPASWDRWTVDGWLYELRDGVLWTRRARWQVMAGVTVQDAGPRAGAEG
jgi:hypothetical protein